MTTATNPVSPFFDDSLDILLAESLYVDEFIALECE